MRDTIDMAREAGIEFQHITGIFGKETISTMGSQRLERIEQLVALVRADERALTSPVAVIGSDFQLLYCREDWAKGLKVGDTLCLCASPAAQPATVQEPIYQMQMMDGKWIDQAKQSYEYNKAHGHTVRIVYTAAMKGQP